MIPICMVYEESLHKKGSVIKHQHQYEIKIQNIRLQYNKKYTKKENKSKNSIKII